jgi:hypothetical protein
VWAVFHSTIELFAPVSFPLGEAPVAQRPGDTRMIPMFRELI